MGMKKFFIFLIVCLGGLDATAQLAKSVTVQYIPRIKEQSLSIIYRQSEKLGFHLNLGYITGYSFFYIRSNDTTYKFLQSKGSGVAVRLATRFIKPSKNPNMEFYLEPLLIFKSYSFRDTAYSQDKDYTDSSFYNQHNFFPNKFRGIERYNRTGIQMGLLLGWQYYFWKNFTASINTGFSFRRQLYSNGF